MNDALQHAPLADLLIEARSGFASGENTTNGILQLRMNNVTADGVVDWTAKRRVPVPHRGINDLALRQGDILFNATNSPELVGKSIFFSGYEEPVTFSNHFLRLRTINNVADPVYISHFLRWHFTRGTFRGMSRQWVNQASINKDQLVKMLVPLPSIEEQRRIAAILDQAESLRTKRRQALAKLETLTQSLFLEMFGDPLANPMRWTTRTIGQMADVQGGLQVTPARTKCALQVPYLRVANVYRDSIDLAEVKIIGASENEFARTQLKAGDVLIVEGHGNPSEIGRCAVWDGSIDGCVHQNHLIRVRFDQSCLLPSFGSTFLNSPVGRRQLLTAARTTSGLNTINVSNVKGVKMVAPPMSLQLQYCKSNSEIQNAKAMATEQQQRLDISFASLQHRAFHGEL